MSLTLQPPELGFKRPFTQEVEQTLRLVNPSQSVIAFKVKTTAPKQYCVRPNSGKVEPGSSVDVSVVLQPMKADPPLDTKCRDKFLVQSVLIPNLDMPAWAELEKAPDFKSRVKEYKIKVHYLPADDATSTTAAAADPATATMNPNGIDDSTMVDDSMISTKSFTPRQRADERAAIYKSEDPTPAVAPAAVVEGLRKRIVGADTPASSTLEDSTAALSSSVASTTREVVDNASQAVSKAKDQVSGQLQQVQSQTGVPVPTVALLCFLVFLLTYFIF